MTLIIITDAMRTHAMLTMLVITFVSMGIMGTIGSWAFAGVCYGDWKTWKETETYYPMLLCFVIALVLGMVELL